MTGTRDNDFSVIRELAKQVAEIAALPEQERKRNQWRKINALQPERAMVMVDQVCWHEMNVDDELTLLCRDKELREWERSLRKTLYQWKHFPVDMVVEDFFRVPMAVLDSGFGVTTEENLLVSDANNDVISHSYINQFKSPEDLNKIKTPVISHDETETKRRLALAEEVFDGILEVFAQGVEPYASVWDPITCWMGVHEVLYALMDEPEMMYAMANRMVNGYMSMFDQMEDQGLLCRRQSLIHCTGAWTDQLPQGELEDRNPATKDMWMFGLAQMFATVSPATFEKFEIETSMPLFERFGMVYYGCCDPLDKKMNEVRKIPNLRKVSMSTWADKSLGAEAIGKDYVYSFKPNPSYLAESSFDENLVRKDLTETKELCERFGCPLEIILKDISTVKYKPQNLWRWAEIAMEVVHS